MFQLSAYRGNSEHAPENTQASLIAAYVGGALVLEIDACSTSDGEAVVAAPDVTIRLGGQHQPVDSLTFAELRKVELGERFSVAGGSATPWKRRAAADPPLARVDRVGAVLDAIPSVCHFLIELHARNDGDLVELARKILDAFKRRGAAERATLAVRTANEVSTLRAAFPESALARIATEAKPNDTAEALKDGSPQLLVVSTSALFSPQGTEVSTFAESLAAARSAGIFARGALVRGDAGGGGLNAELSERLSGEPFKDLIWALSTSSTLQAEPFIRRARVLEKESFAGEDEPSARFHFGYAKNNPYAHVFQQDGVHVEIAPYDEERSGWPVEDASGGSSEERRARALQYQLWDAMKTWPFYSGGGVGTAFGIEGPFVAEVSCKADAASQARMYEMAVVNADPPKHRPGWRQQGGARVPNVPQSFRDKSIFFDPHGAPPFVGSEHDEDDGYRINWNLGVDYDNNQYGRPVGNGTALRCRLRLERRGEFFATYYTDGENPSWVCSGVCRNDSMNERVFLRCAAKRWRQERDEKHPGPSVYMPVEPFHVVFSDLVIRIELPAG